jgi:hypothetical protein
LLSLVTGLSTHGFRLGVLDSNYAWMQSYDGLTLQINPAGNPVSIGATTPAGRLEVAQPTNDAVILRLSNSTGVNGFNFTRSSTTGALSIQGNQTGADNIILAPTDGKVGVGTVPSWPLDAVGDVNTGGVFRKGGVAGAGVGSSITVCTSGACATSCTLIFNGGIRTGGTCP